MLSEGHYVRDFRGSTIAECSLHETQMNTSKKWPDQVMASGNGRLALQIGAPKKVVQLCNCCTSTNLGTIAIVMQVLCSF